jgi:hypothetical protein
VPGNTVMEASISTRAGVFATLAVAVLGAAVCASAAGAQAPIVRQPPSPPQSNAAPETVQSPTTEHLPDWMERHRDLTPQQQQQALRSEPGFQQLPPATQQRMLNRLSQLNSMPQQQRQRMLARAEEMEHLNPDQRQQVRGAMAELGRLPEERRRIVARAFRDLRMMPPHQRQAYMSSEYLHRELSPQERITLGNLMMVEPLLPPPNR